MEMILTMENIETGMESQIHRNPLTGRYHVRLIDKNSGLILPTVYIMNDIASAKIKACKIVE